jgi:hypothetical protein
VRLEAGALLELRQRNFLASGRTAGPDKGSQHLRLVRYDFVVPLCSTELDFLHVSEVIERATPYLVMIVLKFTHRLRDDGLDEGLYFFKNEFRRANDLGQSYFPFFSSWERTDPARRFASAAVGFFAPLSIFDARDETPEELCFLAIFFPSYASSR